MYVYIYASDNNSTIIIETTSKTIRQAKGIYYTYNIVCKGINSS